MIDSLSPLAQWGLTGLILTLVAGAMVRGILRWGPDVDRLIAEKDKRFIDMEQERDEYKLQVQARQSVVDQALELAALLREYSRPAKP